MTIFTRKLIKRLIDLITKESEHHPIQMMCRVLKMPKSTYYQSFHKKPNSYHVANEQLSQPIRAIHKESKGHYAAPKSLKYLKKKAIQAVSIEFNV